MISLGGWWGRRHPPNYNQNVSGPRAAETAGDPANTGKGVDMQNNIARVCNECDRSVDRHGARGLCSRCYARQARRQRAALNLPCGVEGCELSIKAAWGDLCERHRARMRRHGHIQSPGRLTNRRATKMKDYAPMKARILEEQGGVCALCKRVADEWHLDHDHACCGRKDLCEKCVRGVLCRSCNIGLGMFRDDVALLGSVIAYLQR